MFTIMWQNWAMFYAFFWVIPWRLIFRCQGITQKKAHNIQNVVKVWNQENWASSKQKSYQITEPPVTKQDKVKHNMENRLVKLDGDQACHLSSEYTVIIA